MQPVHLHQIVPTKISWIHTEESWLGEFDTQMSYRRQKIQGKATGHLSDQLVGMDGEMEVGKFGKWTNLKRYNV